MRSGGRDRARQAGRQIGSQAGRKATSKKTIKTEKLPQYTDIYCMLQFSMVLLKMI